MARGFALRVVAEVSVSVFFRRARFCRSHSLEQKRARRAVQHPAPVHRTPSPGSARPFFLYRSGPGADSRLLSTGASARGQRREGIWLGPTSQTPMPSPARPTRRAVALLLLLCLMAGSIFGEPTSPGPSPSPPVDTSTPTPAPLAAGGSGRGGESSSAPPPPAAPSCEPDPPTLGTPAGMVSQRARVGEGGEGAGGRGRENAVERRAQKHSPPAFRSRPSILQSGPAFARQGRSTQRHPLTHSPPTSSSPRTSPPPPTRPPSAPSPPPSSAATHAARPRLGGHRPRRRPVAAPGSASPATRAGG